MFFVLVFFFFVPPTRIPMGRGRTTLGLEDLVLMLGILPGDEDSVALLLLLLSAVVVLFEYVCLVGLSSAVVVVFVALAIAVVVVPGIPPPSSYL